jgi:hypothetical protein
LTAGDDRQHHRQMIVLIAKQDGALVNAELGSKLLA